MTQETKADKIRRALRLSPDPLTAGEVAEVTSLPQKDCSTHLAVMFKRGELKKVGKKGRGFLYCLRDEVNEKRRYSYTAKMYLAHQKWKAYINLLDRMTSRKWFRKYPVKDLMEVSMAIEEANLELWKEAHRVYPEIRGKNCAANLMLGEITLKDNDQTQ